jgi:hypothetical protein
MSLGRLIKPMTLVDLVDPPTVSSDRVDRIHPGFPSFAQRGMQDAFLLAFVYI